MHNLLMVHQVVVRVGHKVALVAVHPRDAVDVVVVLLQVDLGVQVEAALGTTVLGGHDKGWRRLVQLE